MSQPSTTGRAPSGAFGSAGRPSRRSTASSVPRTRRDSVRRTELLRRLEDARSRPLVLLTAPAGYGKTTLLTQWAEEDPRPCAWVMPDEAGGDPDALADSIASALASIGVHAGLDDSFVLLVDGARSSRPMRCERWCSTFSAGFPRGPSWRSRREPSRRLDLTGCAPSGCSWR